MTKTKKVFTTGQVAEICKVAPQTVTKWFDAGKLRGYRIPGSRDRRIQLDELVKFMKQHNIPTDTLDSGKLKVLIVDSNADYAKQLADVVSSNSKYNAFLADNSFEAGLLVQKNLPDVIIINMESPKIDSKAICNTLRMNNEFQSGKLIAIAPNLSDSEVEAVINMGFDDCVTNPSDLKEIIGTIEQMSALVC